MYVCQTVNWSTPARPDLVFEQSRGVKVLFPIVRNFKKATSYRFIGVRFGIKSYCSRPKVAEICHTALRLQGAFCLQLIFFVLNSNFGVVLWHAGLLPLRFGILLKLISCSFTLIRKSSSHCLKLIKTFHFL